MDDEDITAAEKERRQLEEEKKVDDEWYLFQNSMYLGAYGIGRGHLGLSGSRASQIIAVIALVGLLLYFVLT